MSVKGITSVQDLMDRAMEVAVTIKVAKHELKMDLLKELVELENA